MTADARSLRTSWAVEAEDLAGQQLEVTVGLVELDGQVDVTLRVGDEGRTAVLPRSPAAERDSASDLSTAMRQAIFERTKVDGEL